MSNRSLWFPRDSSTPISQKSGDIAHSSSETDRLLTREEFENQEASLAPIGLRQEELRAVVRQAVPGGAEGPDLLQVPAGAGGGGGGGRVDGETPPQLAHHEDVPGAGGHQVDPGHDGLDQGGGQEEEAHHSAGSLHTRLVHSR